MTEERLLAATGMPLEDAISMCSDMRRDGTLRSFTKTVEQSRHQCTCGGSGNCPDCPGKNR